MKNKKAFTFVELMIALTIFAVIALGIYSTFSTGLNTWRRAEDANRLQQEARWALDKMAKEITNALSYNYGASYPEAGLFLGEKNEISFLSLLYDPSAKLSQIKRITYSLEIPDYGEIHKTIIGTTQEKLSEVVVNYEEKETVLNSLRRKEETLIQSLQAAEEPSLQSEALSDLVKTEGLLFSYASNQGSEGGENIIWADAWEDKSKLPKGVKITLILQNPKNPAEEATFTKTVFLAQGELGQSSEE